MRTKKIIVLSLWAISIAFALWGLFNLSHPNCVAAFLAAIFLYIVGNELRIEVIKATSKRARK